MIKYDNKFLNDMINNISKDKLNSNIKIYLENILLEEVWLELFRQRGKKWICCDRTK